jgi:choline dehydrogenase-like flavoprotein
MGNNGLKAIEGATKLNWKTGPLIRNAPGCDGCCQCAIGCPHNAKIGVHLSVLPIACQNGTKIVTDLKVLRVITDGSKAVGIYSKRTDGSKVIIYADLVVIAAGATESPGIIRRSEISSHPHLGRNLAVHPAVAVAGKFEEEIFPWHGVLQSASVEEFHESDGILVEATATPPGMGSMVLPGVGSKLIDQINDAKHLVSLGAMISDGPNGRVFGKSRTILTYKMSDTDGSRLIKGIEICSKILFAAGAKEVFTGVTRKPVLKSKDDIRELKEVADYKELHVAAFHPTGSIRAGTDPQICPVDINGNLRGCENLFVIDASLLPSSPTVNPQISIMATAKAISENIVNLYFN